VRGGYCYTYGVESAATCVSLRFGDVVLPAHTRLVVQPDADRSVLDKRDLFLSLRLDCERPNLASDSSLAGDPQGDQRGIEGKHLQISHSHNTAFEAYSQDCHPSLQAGARSHPDDEDRKSV